MAAAGTSFVKTRRMQGFTALLTSAACEWFLIFLLVVDAALSYLMTKFASYCQLQAPCLLCSRLDRVLGGGKPELHQNLLCSNHLSEISSLIPCHIHRKVADGHRMCDDCLLSFTTKTKPHPETHRLLVGKLGLAFGDSKDTRPCTCCGKLWKSGHNGPRSIQLKSPGRAVFKPYIPLPCAPKQSRLNRRGNLKKTRDKSSRSVTSHCLRKKSFDSLSDGLGYSQLRLTSDSESDFPFSDDDYLVDVFSENIESSDDPMAQFKSVIPPKYIPPTCSNPAKQNGTSHNPMPFCLDPRVEPNISKHHDVKFLVSHAVNDYGMGEINWHQAKQKSLSCDLAELISLDEISPSPIVVNISNGEAEDGKITSYMSQNSLPSPLAEPMTLDDSHALVGASPEKSVDATQASGTGLVSENHKKVAEKIGTREKASVETDLMESDSPPVSPRQVNSSNMSEFPVTAREVPAFVTEQPTTEEVDKVKEELKLSPSHNSSPHASNTSSALPIQAEASSSNGIQVLQKSALVESSPESLDGSNVTEVEGESTVDRLKRQIEYDKKRIGALDKELEEERNAAAVAANEAMTMITRLQQEKAALQMEALQYLRMMEEQAEYDIDELEKANDLLAEREKDIQDLEAELEYYRSNLIDEPMVQSMHKESCDLKGESITRQNVGLPDITIQNVGLPNVTNTAKIPHDSKITNLSKVSDEAEAGETSSLEFEDEKLYISQCLKSLEKKLHQISCSGISSHMLNGLEGSKWNQQGSSNSEEPQLNDQIEGTDLSKHKDINASNGSFTDQDVSVVSDSGDCSLSKENNHSTSVGPKSSLPRREVDLVTLGNEISDLNDRLEALEADRHLLEHMINHVRNGNDAKQFIQEIAHQLHELRKIGMRSR